MATRKQNKELLSKCKVTVLKDTPEDVKAFMLSEDGVKKNITYEATYKRYCFVKRTIMESEDKTYFVYKSVLYRVKRMPNSNRYYLRASLPESHTFIIKDGKARYYGKEEMKHNAITAVIKILKLDWFSSEMKQGSFGSFMTMTLQDKVFTGKVTNPVDYFKHYLKSIRMKASPTLMYKAFHIRKFNKTEFLRVAYQLENVDNWLLSIIKVNGLKSGTAEFDKSYVDEDILHQAKLLNRKININWSAKRMMGVHNDWTKELMVYEMGDIDDTTAKYSDTVMKMLKFGKELPRGVNILTTKRDVFAEGKMMSHCCYTNYWNRIEEGRYVLYHIVNEELNENVTLGCSIQTGYDIDEMEVRYQVNEIVFDQVQCYANGNSSVSISAEMRNYVNRLINTEKLFIHKLKIENNEKEQNKEEYVHVDEVAWQY